MPRAYSQDSRWRAMIGIAVKRGPHGKYRLLILARCPL